MICGSLYILDTILCQIGITNIFCLIHGLLFYFINVVFWWATVLNFDEIQFIVFFSFMINLVCILFPYFKLIISCFLLEKLIVQILTLNLRSISYQSSFYFYEYLIVPTPSVRKTFSLLFHVVKTQLTIFKKLQLFPIFLFYRLFIHEHVIVLFSYSPNTDDQMELLS